MALTSELVAGFFIEFRSVSLEDSWQKKKIDDRETRSKT